jgi:hypothetical protein
MSSTQTLPLANGNNARNPSVNSSTFSSSQAPSRCKLPIGLSTWNATLPSLVFGTDESACEQKPQLWEESVVCVGGKPRSSGKPLTLGGATSVEHGGEADEYSHKLAGRETTPFNAVKFINNPHGTPLTTIAEQCSCVQPQAKHTKSFGLAEEPAAHVSSGKQSTFSLEKSYLK